MASELKWTLLYTKQRAEEWAAVNLRKQGFSTLLPRVRARGRVELLFPRYLFVGHDANRVASSIQNTFGVMYVVRCGEHQARIPPTTVAEIQGRMDANGIVTLDSGRLVNPLFAAQQRERLRTIQKFIEAGFTVRAA